MSSIDSLRINVAGGLGNQLFMALGGWALSARLGRRLILNLRNPDINASGHDSSIRDFNLSALTDTTVISRPRGALELALGALAKRRPYSSSRDELMKRFRFGEFEFLQLQNHADMKNAPSGNHLFLEAYLQNHELVAHVPDIIREDFFKLQKPSSRFLKYAQEISTSNSTAIHIRRGDYIHPDTLITFGALGDRYYSDALDALKVDRKNDPIFLFSDSHEEAKKIEGRLGIKNGVVINGGVSPSESIILMSSAAQVIIANSTFSWWSAFLSGPHSEIVAPQPWFRAAPIPARLIPDTWLLVESDWT